MERFDPALPCTEVPGSRTLVVIPKRDTKIDAAAKVPNRYVNAVQTALSDRRVLGERLTVISPERVIVRIKATLVFADGADAETILSDASTRLDARLTDVRQRPDIEPWPTGRPVTLTEMRAVLALSPGVMAVPECELALEDGPFAARDITLARVAIAIAGRHELTALAMPERSIAS